MQRTDLLDAVSLARPALAARELVPILGCLCFDGKSVHAWDDIIGVRVGLETDFVGGVRGEQLLGFLSASKAAEVSVESEDGDLVMKAGRSRARMPVRPVDDFLFELPEGDAIELPLSGAVIDGLKAVSSTMSNDTAGGWVFGVTCKIDPATSELTMYSTDKVMGSRVAVSVEVPDDLDGPLVFSLHPRFVKTLISLSGKREPTKLYVADDWILARLKGRVALLVSVMTETREDLYEETFGAADDLLETTAIKRPKTLLNALDRSLVFSGPESRTRLTISSGKAVMVTSSPNGDCRDTVRFDQHADVDVSVDPAHVKDIAAECDTISVGDLFVGRVGSLTRIVGTIENHEAGEG